MKIRTSPTPQKNQLFKIEAGLKLKPKQTLFKKQQSITVNNIRESSYKIIRSKSNRTDHSLQTKKPLQLCKKQSNSSSKYLPIKGDHYHQCIPKTPINSYTSAVLEKDYCTAETVPRNHHKFINYQEYSIPDHYQEKDSQNQTFTYEKERLGLSKNNKDELKSTSEIESLKIIWKNIKILKIKCFFKAEVIQLERIIEKIVVKIAKQQNCLSDRNLQQISQRKHLKTTNESQNININSQRIQQLFNSKQLQSDERLSLIGSQIEEKKLNYMIEDEQKDEYKSSYDSLRIENEQSHKYEFLHLYQAQINNNKLKDITNSNRASSLSSDINLSSQRSSCLGRASEKISEDGYRDDRVYLRSIIKKTKKTIEGIGQIENIPISNPSNNCCEKTGKENNMQVLTYSCDLFDCQNAPSFSKKQQIPSSSGSSESKREVLNQIITMLNKKYQKNVKIQFNKVLI